ncbi:MAG TPA: DUF4403 family protein, partial [Paludibacter sp.]|nr:DUF4403 family protein [Paludibacter sp.]
MKTNISFFVLAMAFIFTACKTVQIEKPKESYLPSDISPVVSELPLQLELNVKKLEAAINNKMTGLLFEGNNISSKDLSVKVWKAQNFTFTVSNNVIEYKIPLKVWSRFAWRVEKFGLAVGDYYEAAGTIMLNYKTSVNIDKNWKIVTKTTASGYSWIETPKLNIVGVAVPVTPIANYALNRFDQIINDQIDNTLAQSVDLKKYVSQTWSEVQKPRLVSPENNLWVRITPKDIYMSPFTTAGTKLNMAVALNAQIESFVGVQPKANNPVQLPELKIMNRLPQQFNLNLAADVTLEKISQMASEELKNRTFTEGKKSVTITGISIFGSEGKAVFVADLTGSFKGRIYFKGNMTY